MRRLPALMALALALALPGVASAATVGVNVPLDNGAGTWKTIKSSHAKLLRSFVLWNQTDRGALDRYAGFVREARSRGLKVELVVTGSAGNGASPGQYAAAIAAIARRLKGGVVGYEIWNEPDSTEFWPGGPNPAAYAALLKAAHGAVHAADPKAKVSVGGLVANDYDYLRALYANGAKGSFDAVSVHTDTACNTTDPGFYYREPTGRIGRYAFTGYRELHKLMLHHGDRKPIWMSELGWSTYTGPCPVEAKAGGVPGATQARFLTRAYRCLARDRYVTQGSWFELSDIDTGSAVPVNHFGLFTDAFSAKPAWAAFRKARHARPMRCGGALDGHKPTVHFVRPANGTRYFRSLPVRVTANDGRGVKDINLFLDGHYVPLGTRVHGHRASIATNLWRAGKAGYGRHTLVAKARDEARNWATTRLTIVRLAPGSRERIPTRLHVRFGAVSHRAVAIRGHVSYKAGVYGSGAVVFRFERRVKGQWRLAHIRHKSALHAFRFTMPFARTGLWRVRTAYQPRGPYARAAVPAQLLRVR